MPRRRVITTDTQLFEAEEALKTAPCVPQIKALVQEWRDSGFQGVTETTLTLLRHWRREQRLYDGSMFQFYSSQVEAMETLIYIFEVAQKRTRKTLLETYAFQNKFLRLPPYDEFARYCIKMATGSGKTKVMAMAIAWQFLNAVIEKREDFAKTFLVIAPNVIVFDRLKTDFANGYIFNKDPIIPIPLKNMWWDFQCYMREDGERGHSDGVLFLTNIHQLYERPETADGDEPDILTKLLGTKPIGDTMDTASMEERIAKRDGLLMVVNDEAHHTHQEDNVWNQTIQRIHTKCPLTMQLDFSATPRYTDGGLFAWTVYDYPLKDAMKDGIVKIPIKGISKVEEEKSNVPRVKYEGFLVAGVERWREYRDSLQAMNKRPLLFIMMNNTAEADDIADWIRTKYSEDFGGDQTLVIHTDNTGEVSKKDLEKARIASRKVDEDQSPIHAIVSVLMLREGWDVKNVTVVVGLRPYTSKANILPEQTIGRGLRLMFPRNSGGYQERVDIIGNRGFIQFVEELEKIENLKLDTFEVGKDKLQIIIIQPDSEKLEKDITIPFLTPIIVRKKSLSDVINSITLDLFRNQPLPLLRSLNDEPPKSFLYLGKDIFTDETLFERQYTVPPVQNVEEIIGYYASKIASELKLPAQFAVLAPKIREFFQYKAFGKEVDLNNEIVLRSMSKNIASYVVSKEFERIIRSMLTEEVEPEMVTPDKTLSSTPPFPFTSSHLLLQASKSVFNLVTCDNELELSFAKFLQSAEDIHAFAKLPIQFGFAIEYPDTIGNLRYYRPDFIARTNDGTHWVIETKGREDIEVKQKDRSAIRWCENATVLTKVSWKYIKVSQREFELLNPATFEELITGLV